VLIGYLLVVIWRGESEGGYHPRYYLVFSLPFLVILGAFAGRLFQAQKLMSGWAIPCLRDPWHILLTLIAYCGLPLIGMALLAPTVARNTPVRIIIFLLTAAWIPVVELAVIAQLNVTNVTWYYGFICMVGFAGLAAVCLVSLCERHRRLATFLGLVTVLYYSGFLVAYYTTMHGDRPRWQDAVAFLRQQANVSPTNTTPEVFAGVPGVVAFYLGVDPAQTMGHPRVQELPEHPPEHGATAERWYIVEARLLTSEYTSWFAERCTLESRFEARTGSVDRSLLVYRCGPRSPGSASQAPMP
jgi:hypothetical protein